MEQCSRKHIRKYKERTGFVEHTDVRERERENVYEREMEHLRYKRWRRIWGKCRDIMEHDSESCGARLKPYREGSWLNAV